MSVSQKKTWPVAVTKVHSQTASGTMKCILYEIPNTTKADYVVIQRVLLSPQPAVTVTAGGNIVIHTGIVYAGNVYAAIVAAGQPIGVDGMIAGYSAPTVFDATTGKIVSLKADAVSMNCTRILQPYPDGKFYFTVANNALGSPNATYTVIVSVEGTAVRDEGQAKSVEEPIKPSGLL